MMRKINNSLGCKLILCGLFLLSCTVKTANQKSDNSLKVNSMVKSKEKFDHQSLISFKSEFVMEDGLEVDALYNNRSKFISPFVSKTFSRDTLRVTTLHEVNSCAETVGRIRFSNDSLFLLVEQVGDLACTSVEYRKYYYVIVKKNIEKYTIVF